MFTKGYPSLVLTVTSGLIKEWGNWYLNPDPATNPIMSNWTKVMVLYCDGASWTGSNDTVTHHNAKKLYFKGPQTTNHKSKWRNIWIRDVFCYRIPSP